LDTVEDITSSLNDYIATVFTTEDTPDIPIPTTSGVPIDNLQDVHFSEEDVRLLLSGIRSDKAGGADELSPRLLLDYVATPLYLLFRKGIDTGMVPEDWKCANITQIHGHGITGKLLTWILEWLAGRKQRVCINGVTSKWQFVLSGVAQGSVLGPILFLIFINDLDCGIINWILKFADDTKIFGIVNSIEEHADMQEDLNNCYLGPRSGKCCLTLKSARLCILVEGMQVTVTNWIPEFLMKLQRKKTFELQSPPI